MPPPKTRVLLVDDDPSFGRILKAEAKRRGVSLFVCVSLENPEFLAGQSFDVALVDYNLGDITAPELSEHLLAAVGHIPIVLVSSTDFNATERAKWPKHFSQFVSKKLGAKAILDAALSVLGSEKPSDGEGPSL